ncbi:acVLRF1 family peptidyl-tRNA hydrolase [Pseudactinotalea sp. Z1739]|uniref:acVLRF1 family peptidyl-tRNA hydrolase n=1 Tax=Pseudactinotalea sp. Z1739 TaxID=3413028 RepID=UPI003C7AD04D
MTVRTVHVPIERIGTWITGFADRHEGAVVLARSTADDDGAEVVRIRGGDGELAEFSRWPLGSGASGGAGECAGLDLRFGEEPGTTGAANPEATNPDDPSPDYPDPGATNPDATSAATLAAISAWCAPPTHLGLVLIRRGGYAVGRAEGPRLRSHKSGTKYVQSRTAAGGWSQQRFARRRGNQADALVGAVVELAAAHLLPGPVGSAPQLPQGLVVGGDRALGEQVLADPVLAQVAALPRRTFADLPEPRFVVLEQALRRGRSVPIQITRAK